jgi:hypothetical protein
VLVVGPNHPWGDATAEFVLLISQESYHDSESARFSATISNHIGFQNLQASGVIRLAKKRPSAMTDEAPPIHDHGSLNSALSDLANADQAW